MEPQIVYKLGTECLCVYPIYIRAGPGPAILCANALGVLANLFVWGKWMLQTTCQMNEDVFKGHGFAERGCSDHQHACNGLSYDGCAQIAAN